jgi:hypothetical protein
MKLNLAIWASFLGTLAASVVSAAEKQDTFSLKSLRSPDMVDRVESTLEVSGTLKLGEGRAPDPKKAAAVKMSATAALAYAEKSLKIPASADLPHRSIRYYEKATAAIRVGDESFSPSLRDERRLISVDVRSPKVVIFCPKGLLTREELDLVDLLGNSLVIDRLLPSHSVAVGASWKHPDKLLATLCGLDTVDQCTAESVLQSVADTVAQIEMAGHVAGTVNGRSSEIQVKAKYRFDMKAQRITWFALLVKESRAPGPIGPGLEVVARVQTKITPAADCPQLAAAAIQGLPHEPTTELEQLSYAARDAGWETTHDRRWMIISEKKDATVLRMADGGAYVAQCNISPVAPAAAKQLSLAEFQDEIRQALGKNFGQFVRASQTVTKAEYEIYRVAVHGEVSGVPIDWIYYRVADRSGRQLVVLFTVEADMGGKFQESDLALIAGLRFSEPKVAAVPPRPIPETGVRRR